MSKVALIIGAGPRLGRSVADSFKSAGYAVALAARSLTASSPNDKELHIQADITDSSAVSHIFSTTADNLGVPSVVIYNAAIFHSDGDDPILGFTAEKLKESLSINTIPAILSMAEAIKGFRTLGEEASKTFIYTGNCLNILPIKPMLTFGIGKGATASAIRAAVANKEYGKEGIKFYYADERTAEGGPVLKGPDGEEAGKVYLELAQKREQGNWNYIYVKGQGEKQF